MFKPRYPVTTTGAEEYYNSNRPCKEVTGSLKFTVLFKSIPLEKNQKPNTRIYPSLTQTLL